MPWGRNYEDVSIDDVSLTRKVREMMEDTLYISQAQVEFSYPEDAEHRSAWGTFLVKDKETGEQLTHNTFALGRGQSDSVTLYATNKNDGHYENPILFLNDIKLGEWDDGNESGEVSREEFEALKARVRDLEEEVDDLVSEFGTLL